MYAPCAPALLYYLNIKNQNVMNRKVNWNVVVNAVLTCITTILSAITLHSCIAVV